MIVHDALSLAYLHGAEDYVATSGIAVNHPLRPTFDDSSTVRHLEARPMDVLHAHDPAFHTIVDREDSERRFRLATLPPLAIAVTLGGLPNAAVVGLVLVILLVFVVNAAKVDNRVRVAQYLASTDKVPGTELARSAGRAAAADAGRPR